MFIQAETSTFPTPDKITVGCYKAGTQPINVLCHLLMQQYFVLECYLNNPTKYDNKIDVWAVRHNMSSTDHPIT